VADVDEARVQADAAPADACSSACAMRCHSCAGELQRATLRVDEWALCQPAATTTATAVRINHDTG
jgi:hypothetical protein